MKTKSILHSFRKIALCLALVATLAFSSINPPQANAQLSVHDLLGYITWTASAVANKATAVSTALTAGGTSALVTKGYVLDPLAWSVAKLALNSLVQSTVRWINNGFNGSPAFVTNLQNTLLSTSNANANVFLRQLSSSGSIRSPFQNAVAAAVGNSYRATTNGGFFTSNPYTLNKTTSKDAAFFNGNFVQGGGLSTWASAWSNTSNNPFGATLLAQDALNNSNAAAVSNQNQEIRNGNGFLSYKGNCNSKTTTSGGSNTTSLSNTNNCLNASILTPGSVIGNQLYKALGSGADQLVSANQLGDIVNALVGQLFRQVLGSGGLAGTTRPSTAGGTSVVDQLTTSNNSSATGFSGDFTQVLTGQQTQLRGFLTQWQKIDTAALAAQNGLQSSSCPNAQTVLTTVVQPVLTQATTQISKAQTSLNSIQSILSESNSASGTNSAAGLTQAATDFATLQGSSNLPSMSDIQYAQAQSVDSGAVTPPTLYTQMNKIAQNPNDCTALQSQS